MSVFTPNVPPIPRPGQPELLAQFVPSALRRTPPVAKIWKLPRLILLGIATAGFVPAFALHTRVRRVLMMHAQQCELASTLLATRMPADDAKIVQSAAANVRVGEGGLWFSLIAMIAGVGGTIAWLGDHHARHRINPRSWADFILHAPRPDDGLAWAVLAALSISYLALVIQINRQLVAMQQYTLAFNAACGDTLGPIDPPPLVWGLRGPHVVAGAVMAWFGLFWALPMMLAWAAFTTFVQDAAYRFRVRLAERVQQFSGVEPVVPTIDLCPNRDCRCGIPAGAAFCPRCGTPLLVAAH